MQPVTLVCGETATDRLFSVPIRLCCGSWKRRAIGVGKQLGGHFGFCSKHKDATTLKIFIRILKLFRHFTGEHNTFQTEVFVFFVLSTKNDIKSLSLFIDLSVDRITSKLLDGF